MHKNYFNLLISIILVVLVCGCKTYTTEQHTKQNYLKSINSLYFDNRVSIDNIVDLGMIEADATVTEIFDKNETFLTGDKFKITIDNSGEVIFDAGSILHEGNMVPIAEVTGIKEGSVLLYKNDFELIQKFKAEALARSIADYNLMEAAKQKNATAIMIPQYSCDIKVEENIRKGLIGKTVEYSKTVYTVHVVARAVNFRSIELLKKEKDKDKEKDKENKKDKDKLKRDDF